MTSAQIISEDGPEIETSFENDLEWKHFLKNNDWVFDRSIIDNIVSRGRAIGLTNKFLGHVEPLEVAVTGTNYRETFLAKGFNPRQRVMMDIALSHIDQHDPRNMRIYAHEALTDFALIFRGRFPRFIGSEYAADVHQDRWLFPIPAVDISKSPFPSDAFDLVLSGDVFEHVSDLEACLADTARILKEGGCLLATFPFAYDRYDTIVKARLNGNVIEYLAEPEYHGNPVNDAEGSLVFQIPGWEILEKTVAAGFRKAEIVFRSSASSGFTATEIAGILLLRAIK